MQELFCETNPAFLFFFDSDSKIDLCYSLTFTLLNILCQLTNKNVIAQFGIVLCYFLFYHLTGQALSPPGRGLRGEVKGKKRKIDFPRRKNNA